MPQGDNYALPKLDFIPYDNAFRNVLNLLLSLLSSTDLESIISDYKIRFP